MFEAVELLKQGGWPIVFLGLCSLAGLTVVIERIVALRRSHVFDPRVLRALEDYEDERSADRTMAACQRAHGPFARLIEEILRSRHLGHTQSLEHMRTAGRTQVDRLERGLTVLEIVAAVSPLIGLLGTVLGMVAVFNAITAEGLGNPQILSAGISQALVTTVAGLTVAIPALAFHSLLTKRVDMYAVEMQDRATTFIFKMHGRRQANH